MHYHFGDFMLDEAGQELRCREAIVALEPKAFQVLCYLLRHRDRVVSRDELFAQCWPDTFVSDWALTRCVARIRKAVGNGRDGGACIKTIHGRGYRFVAPLTVTPNATALPPASQADRAPALMLTTRPTQGEAAAAERRVLTVLCGVLVDPQACQRDPEEARVLVQAYHAFCAEVIHALEGYVAQYLRDAVIAYFGVPQAHDDDAQRSVWAGLRLRDALQARLAPGRGDALSLRVGIHTGPVVVGELGPEQSGLLAVGETPAIAERLTALALPGTVVISAATARLVDGYFHWQAWEVPEATEVAAAGGAYQVLGERPAHSRFEVMTQRGLTPLVGREAERGLLRARWAEATGGLGQVVVIMGEPGIGKSRLVQSLADQLAGEPYTRIEWRCAPYAQQSPLQPVIAHLHRVLHWRADETPDEHLAALEAMVAARHLALPELVPLLASLLAIPLPARYAPLALTPQRQREKTLEAMLAWVRAEAMAQPVLFIVEDLHWMDPSTLELLTRLLEQGPVPRLLTLLTCRPEFALPWGFRAHLTPLTLPRLPQAEAAQMIGGLTDGTPLPPAVIAQIVAKTDGVPLFIEELTKMMLESGLLQERDGRYELPGPLPPLAIPATLHDSLMARLDRLSPFKAVAQLGATIGRMFPYELLRAVTSLDEVTLQQGLRHLVAAELVYQQGLPPQATYLFKHALIQEAAYQSLLKSTRQQYHQRIAQVLVERFPALVETQPEVVAQHYTAAGVAEHAVHYWHQAGRGAQARSAHEEAVVHLTSSLTLLRTLPATRARDAQELTVRIHLGTSLAATQGWAAPAAEVTYTRAWELCQRASDTSQRLSVLWGLAHVYVVRADLPHHREVGARMRALAAQQADPVPRMVAHWLTGQNLFHTGELAAGLTHLEHAYALYDAQHHRLYITLFGVDIGVFTLAYLAHALWGLGYAAQAVQRSQEALGLAQARQHPFSHALAHAYAAMLQQWRRDPHTATAHAEAAMALGREHGFAYYLAWGRIIQGWCLRDQAQPAEGMAEIREGLTALRATGGALRLSYYLALLAEAHGEDRQPGEGLRCLTEAFVHQATTHERWTTAELSRLKGEWLLRQTPPDALQAEACFRDSLDLARGQHAKALELRAAMSLGRLWQQQGKRGEAYELLAPIYGWFTEGFDTADLQEAQALLEELAG